MCVRVNEDLGAGIHAAFVDGEKPLDVGVVHFELAVVPCPFVVNVVDVVAVGHRLDLIPVWLVQSVNFR